MEAAQQQLLQALLLQQMMGNPELLKQAQEVAKAQLAAQGIQAISASTVGDGNAPHFVAPPTWVASPGPGAEKPLCKYYNEGKCHRGQDCPYRHEGKVRSKKMCRDFKNWGSCSRGDNCGYSHDPSTQPDTQPRESRECAIHGCMRTIENMQEDGKGGYTCMPGQECRVKKVRVYDPDWNCPNCGDLQFGKKIECTWCRTPNPNKEIAICAEHNVKRSMSCLQLDAEGKLTCEGNVKCRMGDTDWTCPKCGDYVFCSRQECRRCGTINPNKEQAVCTVHEVSRAMEYLVSDGNGGYMCKFGDCQSKKSTEDWFCPKCKDRQYARNLVCRWCGVPNPNLIGGTPAICNGPVSDKPVDPPVRTTVPILVPPPNRKRPLEEAAVTPSALLEQNWALNAPPEQNLGLNAPAEQNWALNAPPEQNWTLSAPPEQNWDPNAMPTLNQDPTVPPQKPAEICKWFLKGQCWDGSRCRNIHPAAEGELQ